MSKKQESAEFERVTEELQRYLPFINKIINTSGISVNLDSLLTAKRVIEEEIPKKQIHKIGALKSLLRTLQIISSKYSGIFRDRPVRLATNNNSNSSSAENMTRNPPEIIDLDDDDDDADSDDDECLIIENEVIRRRSAGAESAPATHNRSNNNVRQLNQPRSPSPVSYVERSHPKIIPLEPTVDLLHLPLPPNNEDDDDDDDVIFCAPDPEELKRTEQRKRELEQKLLRLKFPPKTVDPILNQSSRESGSNIIQVDDDISRFSPSPRSGVASPDSEIAQFEEPVSPDPVDIPLQDDDDDYDVIEENRRRTPSPCVFTPVSRMPIRVPLPTVTPDISNIHLTDQEINNLKKINESQFQRNSQNKTVENFIPSRQTLNRKPSHLMAARTQEAKDKFSQNIEESTGIHQQEKTQNTSFKDLPRNTFTNRDSHQQPTFCPTNVGQHNLPMSRQNSAYETSRHAHADNNLLPRVQPVLPSSSYQHHNGNFHGQAISATSHNNLPFLPSTNINRHVASPRFHQPRINLPFNSGSQHPNYPHQQVRHNHDSPSLVPNHSLIPSTSTYNMPPRHNSFNMNQRSQLTRGHPSNRGFHSPAYQPGYRPSAPMQRYGPLYRQPDVTRNKNGETVSYINYGEYKKKREEEARLKAETEARLKAKEAARLQNQNLPTTETQREETRLEEVPKKVENQVKKIDTKKIEQVKEKILKLQKEPLTKLIDPLPQSSIVVSKKRVSLCEDPEVCDDSIGPPSPQCPPSPEDPKSPQCPPSPDDPKSPHSPPSPDDSISPQSPPSPDDPKSPQCPPSPEGITSPQSPLSSEGPMSPQNLSSECESTELECNEDSSSTITEPVPSTSKGVMNDDSDEFEPTHDKIKELTEQAKKDPSSLTKNQLIAVLKYFNSLSYREVTEEKDDNQKTKETAVDSESMDEDSNRKALIGGDVTDSSTENQDLSSNNDVPTKKKQAKRRNSLDKLHDYINIMWDKEDIMRATGPRHTKTVSYKENSAVRNDSSTKANQKNTEKPAEIVVCKPSIVKLYRCDEKIKSLTKPISRGVAKRGKRRGPTMGEREKVNLDENNEKDITCPYSDNINTPALQHSVVSETEQSSENDLVSPETQFLFPPCDKSGQSTKKCLYCKSHGHKKIIDHYLKEHPGKEILTSRLSLEDFEIAVTGRMGPGITLICRFCSTKRLEMNDFYDHLTEHTGEYRHKCPSCPLVKPSQKAIIAHINKFHKNLKIKNPIELGVIPDFDSRIVPGFVCGFCRYTQLSRENIEKHVKLRHENEPVSSCYPPSVTISQINMANFQCTANEEEEEEVVVKEIKTEPCEATDTCAVEYSIDQPDIRQNPREVLVSVQNTANDDLSHIQGHPSNIEDGLNNRNNQDNEEDMDVSRATRKRKLTQTSNQADDQAVTNNKKPNIRVRSINELTAENNTPTALTQIPETTRVNQPEIRDQQVRTILDTTLIGNNNNGDEKRRKAICTTFVPKAKNPKVYTIMKKLEKIRCFYKCMGHSCDFTTDNKKKIGKHFRNHELLLKRNPNHKHNEKIFDVADKKFVTWKICCYCCLGFETTNKLVVHLELEHGNSHYQCNTCFYRSCSSSNVMLHITQSHHDDSEADIILCRKNEVEPFTPVSTLRERIEKEIIIPYKCNQGTCNRLYFLSDSFRSHMEEEHFHDAMFNCYKCNAATYNLENLIMHLRIHGINEYQCLYCKHGASKREDLHRHLYVEHPNNIPFIFVRAEMVKQDENGKPVLINNLIRVIDEEKPIFLPPDIRDMADPINESECALRLVNPYSGETNMEYEESAASNCDTNPETHQEETNQYSLKEDLDGHQLYRCCNKSCNLSFENSEELSNHLMVCGDLSEGPSALFCVHCKRSFRQVSGLVEHVRNIHGPKRFTCGICSDIKAANLPAMVRHFKYKHKTASVLLKPEDPAKNNQDVDKFIALVKSSPIKATSPKKVTSKSNVYSPQDIENLPKQPIFQTSVQCSECSFSDRVRTNMIRHLRGHLEGSEDVTNIVPVNPVPCLENKERYFDKMTNWAGSSHMNSDGSINKPQLKRRSGADLSSRELENLPRFIPEKRRYVCGAENCSYVTMTVEMLEMHVKKLHAEEIKYNCPHCPELGSFLGINANFWDRVVVHLKLHGNTLYRCAVCNHHHFNKKWIERHMCEKHPDSCDTPLVIREPDIPDVEVGQNNWLCSECGKGFLTGEEAKNHCKILHNIRSQYRCALCSMRSTATTTLEQHISSKHPGQPVLMYAIYYKAGCTDERLIRGVPSNTMETEEVVTPPATTSTNYIALDKITHIRQVAVEYVKSSEVAQEKRRQSKESNESTTNYKFMFGPYGSPVDNQFACPICKKYTNKSRINFQNHLFRDFSYRRHVCNLCNAAAYCKANVIKHITTIHKEVETDPTQLVTVKNERPELESWVKDVIAHQMTLFKTKADESKDDNLLQSFEKSPLKGVASNNTEPSPCVNTKDPLVSDDQTFQDLLKTPDTSKTKPVKKQTNLKDEDGPIISCTECNYKTTKLRGLKAHIKIAHLKMGTWVCAHCGKTSNSDKFLINHSNKSHPDLPLNIIKNVDRDEKDLSEEDYLERFGIQKNDGKVSGITGKIMKKCRFCNFSTHLNVSLKRHELKHSEKNIYKCEYCNFSGSYKYVLNRHSDKEHPGCALKISKCDSVDEKKPPEQEKVTVPPPAPSSSLTQIINTSETRIQCDYCTFTATTTCEMHNHWSSTHSSTGVQFRYEASSPPQSQPLSNSPRKGVKRDFLPESHGSFLHQNQETNEDPCKVVNNDTVTSYICYWCKEKMNGKKELVVHTHAFHSHLHLKYEKETNKILYQCPLCEKKSDSQKSMREHIKALHVSDYQCPKCYSVYPSFEQTKNHIIATHEHADLLLRSISKCLEKFESLAMQIKKVEVLTTEPTPPKIRCVETKSTRPKRLHATSRPNYNFSDYEDSETEENNYV